MASITQTPYFSPGFLELLRSSGLLMHPIKGDGNCLFRAVALQVYGSPEPHGLLRQRCMDFIENSRATYEPFTGPDFEGYVAVKRRDGMETPLAWGGHMEVQALSEMFSTRFEIYDAETGKTVNIDHESYSDAEVPVRLSYHHGNHYNALVSRDSGLRRGPVAAFVEQNVVRKAMAANDRQIVEDQLVDETAEDSIRTVVDDLEVRAVMEAQEKDFIQASLGAAERAEEERALQESMQQLEESIRADEERALQESMRHMEEQVRQQSLQEHFSQQQQQYPSGNLYWDDGALEDDG